MERLTDNENYCKIIGCTSNLRGCSCFEDELYRKLKEYEDLEEQVLKATGADIASMVVEYMHYYNLQKENRMLELPCKVGDKVYILDDIVDTDKCKNCDFYYWGGMGDYPACNKTKYGFRAVDCIELKEKAISFENILYCLGNDVFGKKVFLTKAEAEKALAEMSKDCTDCRNYWQNTDTGNECNGQDKPCHEFVEMEK